MYYILIDFLHAILVQRLLTKVIINQDSFPEGGVHHMVNIEITIALGDEFVRFSSFFSSLADQECE